VGSTCHKKKTIGKEGEKERGSTVAVKMASDCGGGIAGALEVELVLG